MGIRVTKGWKFLETFQKVFIESEDGEIWKCFKIRNFQLDLQELMTIGGSLNKPSYPNKIINILFSDTLETK